MTSHAIQIVYMATVALEHKGDSFSNAYSKQEDSVPQ